MSGYLGKRHLSIIAAVLLAAVFALWSWNTLSNLFGLPIAQYRHVLALFFLGLILKGFVSPPGQRPHDADGACHGQPTD